ncbi:MAG: hypothetical protein WDM78_17305 [Puia sp.]
MALEDKFPDNAAYTPGNPYPALDAIRAKIPQMITGVIYANYGAQLTVVGPTVHTSKEKRFIEQTGIFSPIPSISGYSK